MCSGRSQQRDRIDANPRKVRTVPSSPRQGCESWGAGLHPESCAVVVTVLCITSPVAAAFGWSTQTLPTSFGSPGGVSCSAPSACIAVGGFTGPARQGQSLAARWDGRRWFRQQTPDPAGGAGSLESVSCSSRTACVAVGSCDCSPAPQPLAERWDGREWSIQRIHYRVGAGTWLYAVSCSLSVRVHRSRLDWAKGGPVGRASAALGREILVCVVGPQLRPGATGIFLVGVSCVTSVHPALLSAGALTVHWARSPGRSWSGGTAGGGRSTACPGRRDSSSSQLESVSCTSSTGCTAVGNGPRGPLVERLNGNRWSIQPSPGGPPAQSAARCRARPRRYALRSGPGLPVRGAECRPRSRCWPSAGTGGTGRSSTLRPQRGVC